MDSLRFCFCCDTDGERERCEFCLPALAVERSGRVWNVCVEQQCDPGYTLALRCVREFSPGLGACGGGKFCAAISPRTHFLGSAIVVALRCSLCWEPTGTFDMVWRRHGLRSAFGEFRVLDVWSPTFGVWRPHDAHFDCDFCNGAPHGGPCYWHDDQRLPCSLYGERYCHALLFGTVLRMIRRFQGFGRHVLVQNNMDSEKLEESIPRVPVAHIEVVASETKEMAFKQSDRQWFPTGAFPVGIGRFVAHRKGEKAGFHAGLGFLLDIGMGKVVLMMTDHQRQRAAEKDMQMSFQGPVGLAPIGELHVLAHGVGDMDFLALKVSDSNLRSLTGVKALKLCAGVDSFNARCFGYDEETDRFWESHGRADRLCDANGKTMRYAHHCTTTNGSSGAPLVCHGIGVVGIHTGGRRMSDDETPAYNLATSLTFLRQMRKLKGLETNVYFRDDFVDQDFISKWVRLNRELDPMGYWEDDIYYPEDMDDKYDYLLDEDLYDLAAYGVRGPLGVDGSLEFRLEKKIQELGEIAKALTPVPDLLVVEDLTVGRPKPRKPLPAPTLSKPLPVIDISELEELVEPLFRESPASVGVPVVDPPRQKDAKAPPVQESLKLKEKVAKKIMSLEQVYGLDMAFEKSMPCTKALNLALDKRLQQLSSYTKQLKREMNPPKKKALASSESGQRSLSGEAVKQKRKKNLTFSKRSEPVKTEAEALKDVCLAMVNQLGGPQLKLQVSDSKSEGSNSQQGAAPIPPVQ